MLLTFIICFCYREILGLANILVGLHGADHKRKRHRTSPEQLMILEQMFKGNRTPDFETRAKLSKQLGMTPRRIQIWFQNKRAKMKKIQQEDYGFGPDNGNVELQNNDSPSSSDCDSATTSPKEENFASYTCTKDDNYHLLG